MKARDTAWAMSQENVETLVHAFGQAIENPEAFFEIFDEDVEWDMTGGPFPEPRIDHGVGAVREFFRTGAGTFQDWNYEAEGVIDAGGVVFVCLRQWGRGKTSGVPVDARFFQVWTFKEGKVVHYKGFVDRDEALKAAGLSE